MGTADTGRRQLHKRTVHQIEKERQALREIQAKITDYFKVRAKFDEEFETAFEVPKRSLFGHVQPRVLVRRRK